MSVHCRSVFFDPNGRRARTTNVMLAVIAFVASCGLAVVGLGVLVAPSLPKLSAPPAESRNDTGTPNRSSSGWPELQISPARNRQVPEQALRAKRLAFFDENDVGSIPALKRHAAELDGIIPEWLSLSRSEFTGRPELHTGSETVVNADGSHRVRSAEVTSWLRQNAPHLEVYPQLTSNLTANETALVLAAPDSRSRLVEQLTEYLRQNSFQGVTVSLPDLPNSHRHVVVFLSELGNRLRAEGRKLIVEVSGFDLSHRMQALSQAADYVLLNLHKWYLAEAYDRTSRPGAGPLAGQGWFEDQLWAHVAKIGPGKLIIGIGSFGYDWDAHGIKRPLSVPAAWDLMERFSASLRFDDQFLNPTFNYVDRAGLAHEVWFLDGVTAFNQIRAALASQPAGIAIWRLGLEDPGVWVSAGRNRVPDRTALEALQTLQPGFDLFSRAKGALLSAAPGSTGTRTVAFNDSLSLIVGQSVSRVPRQAQITEWHPVDPKAVAITFDDGPDPVYTAKILDILAEKGAKATFYVIGRNALSHPELLRRMYDEGHDVGSHSFSHENIFQSSGERIELELNAVQRIFEAQLGINSVLFRTPYAFGPTFQYLDGAPQLVATASRLGYLHANIDTDGYDWVWTSSKIVDRVIAQVSEGRGQVLLLHDAGGNRQATIRALPQIIDQLRAKGFRFVATHELVGRPRHEVMPPKRWATPVTEAQSDFGLAYVRVVAWFGEVVPVVAIGTAALGMLRLGLILIAAYVQKRRARRRKPSSWRPASIAVLVPAYNEEKVICKTIQTLLSSSVAEAIEIIVIDDGSSDRTSDVVRETYASVDQVKVYWKENGGKAAALNYGIAQTRAEIIVAIDGDTVLLPDAIERLAAHFQDPSVGAVAGKVVVGNQINLMTRFQALEYLMSQNLDRRAFELFNAIGVVPGAIGAWRRQALVEVGGYSHDTLAEDADLTIALERRGWKVLGEPGAVALTEAPETLKAFLKQRFRWMFGTLQVAYKHSRALLGRPCGVSLITIPNVFLFQFAFTLLAPIMDLLLLWNVMVQVRSLVLSGSAQADTSLMLLQYWIFFQTIDVLAAAAAVSLEGGRAEWRLVHLLILQRFSYRQLLYWVAVRTLLAAIKGSFVGWGKLIRTGSVSLPVQTSEAR